MNYFIHLHYCDILFYSGNFSSSSFFSSSAPHFLVQITLEKPIQALSFEVRLYVQRSHDRDYQEKDGDEAIQIK
jgi:hypothetical protein